MIKKNQLCFLHNLQFFNLKGHETPYDHHYLDVFESAPTRLSQSEAWLSRDPRCRCGMSADNSASPAVQVIKDLALISPSHQNYYITPVLITINMQNVPVNTLYGIGAPLTVPAGGLTGGMAATLC